MQRRPNPHFWRGKRVLLTGHTGFKGAWLCQLLHQLGAQVSGVALAASPRSAFELLQLQDRLHAHHLVDIRQAAKLQAVVQQAQPEVVLHLAAQALVGESYRQPQATFDTNVNGTIHLLQALRGMTGVQAAVMVTSDKVYRNDNSGVPFTEDHPLGGHDPYSASKAAAEIAIASWRHSFGHELPAMASVRAGNVIGGGDFGDERLIPDLVRAQVAGQSLALRHPHATRPFQHVLDVLNAYLLLAEQLATQPQHCPEALNIGPANCDTEVLALMRHWEDATGQRVVWHSQARQDMPEKHLLALNSQLAKDTLGWQAQWDTPQAIGETARWYQAWMGGEDMQGYSQHSVARFLESNP